jgi:hypothetical protein
MLGDIESLATIIVHILAIIGVAFGVIKYLHEKYGRIFDRLDHIEKQLTNCLLNDEETDRELTKLQILQLIQNHKSPAVIQPLYDKYLNVGGNSYVIEIYCDYKEQYTYQKEKFDKGGGI